MGIVGAGTIGASWGAFYASKGLRVGLFDNAPEIHGQAVERAREHLSSLARCGLLTPDACTRAGQQIEAAASIEEVAQGADFVHEAATETYEVKQPIFARLDECSPADVLLASSSSGLLTTRIQQSMSHPHRALIAHPFNPPHLIPLVELVAGDHTDPRAVEVAHAFFTGLGKIPVVLRREVPGHVANRLAAALWREALDLVAGGVASVEDVDKALCAGPGLRWALMGQHLIFHLGGGQGGYAGFIDHIGESWTALWEDMPTWTRIPPEARAEAVAGVEQEVGDQDLSELAAWRDGKLAELIKVIYGDAG